jgi:signal transduction histidine kinase
MLRFPRLSIILIGAVTAVLLAGLAYLMVAANHSSRQDLEHGVRQRAKLAAALIEATFDSTIVPSSQAGSDGLHGQTVGTAAVRKATGGIGTAGVLIGPDGRVLAAWPARSAPVGTRVDSMAGPVEAVLRGRPWALGLDPPGRVVNLATVVKTPYGRRVSVSSFPTALLQPFLGTLLSRVRTGREDNAFLIDTQGTVLGTAGGTPSAARRTLPPRGTGTVRIDGREAFYVNAPIRGTDWHVVVTVTKAGLYAPINGTQAWLPWLLLSGFAVMAGVVVLLVRRLALGGQRLSKAYARLESRNEEVMAADRLKSDFLATMSHELRTPLNGIIGFAELMHDGRVGPVSDRHKEYLGDILSSSTHLRRLIDDTLDLAKIEAGKMDLRPEPVDPRVLLAEVVDGVSSLASRKAIDLRAEIDPGIGELVLDPGKLRQVLFNYLSNALKFTPDGGRVTVRAAPEGEDRVRITVDDTGPGISPEDLTRLWTAFEQLEAGSARRYGGTGLGLSLTRQIVEAQGGEVGVDSVLGEGSRFYVILPRVPAATAGTADERRPALV